MPQQQQQQRNFNYQPQQRNFNYQQQQQQNVMWQQQQQMNMGYAQQQPNFYNQSQNGSFNNQWQQGWQNGGQMNVNAPQRSGENVWPPNGQSGGVNLPGLKVTDSYQKTFDYVQQCQSWNNNGSSNQ